MSELRIWAPSAKQVDVELVDEDRCIPMHGSDGVFSLTSAQVTGRYQLRVDGFAMPSPWADDVEGVFGPCTVDREPFVWTDATFRPMPLSEGIVYELHIGTFTEEGTFDAAASRLPYLVELGVTHVELMPVATFPGARGWGYDGAALYAPHRAYGGPAGLRRFVDAAHRHGIAVLLDVVYNHLGPTGNFLDRLGPFFHADVATPWGAAINFDRAGADEVRRFFIDNALRWLRDFHCDGLRLDAVHAFIDNSARSFLEELAAEVATLAAQTERMLVLVAETDRNDPRPLLAPAHGGFGIDAQWSDDFHHALHALLTGEGDGHYRDFCDAPLAHLARCLSGGWAYTGQLSRFRGRRHGRPLGELRLDRLFGYAQTHDQVGNRAGGERLSHLVPEKLALATTLVLMAPFVPMLFMGEEWGASTPFLFFTDHVDPAVASATTIGRRRELAEHGARVEDVPDPQSPDTFLRSKLCFDERERSPHRELLEHVRALIALRRRESALRDGRVAIIVTDETQRTLHFERGPFAVVCNFGDHDAAFSFPNMTAVIGTPRFDGGRIWLAPATAVVLRKDAS